MRILLCSLSVLIVMLCGSSVPLAVQKRNLVGAIKNKSVVGGCGCYFYAGRRLTGASKEIFASGEDESAWMNIDGVDTKLKFISRTEPSSVDRRGAPRVGSRNTEKYGAGDIAVDILFIVTDVCAPQEPQCESTGYAAIFRVRKGRRTQVLRANGACGC